MKSLQLNLAGIFTIVATLLTIGCFSSVKPIVAEDNLKISVRGVPSEEVKILGQIYPVSKAGTINLPFIGAIQARGKEPAQLEAEIAAAYQKAEIYPDPTFSVLVLPKNIPEKKP